MDIAATTVFLQKRIGGSVILSLQILLMVAGTMEAQPSVPVWSGSLPPANSVKGNLCNLAVVSGMRSTGRLRVRAGPAVRFSAIDTLKNGERVYTCNEHDEWIGVVYDRPGAQCGTKENAPLDITLTRSCRSGWVHRRWVEVLTG